MVALKQKGHTVFFLSQDTYGQLHEELEKKGILCFSSSSKKKNILPKTLSEMIFVSRFIKNNKINIVLSHLGANLPSVFIRYFVNAHIYIFRHHTNEVNKYGNFRGKLGQWIINRLAYRIVSPCENVTQHLISEGVNKNRIIYIPYGYDFSMYPVPDIKIVRKIKEKYQCRLLLTVVARHVPSKRHFLLLQALASVINEKCLDIKCLLLDEGPLTNNLQQFVQLENLENNIFFIGYSKDVMNYISAADFIPHISESEASNSVIKEAGMLKKNVAICKGVGDFDDYIEDFKNGFSFDLDKTKEQLEEVLSLVYENPEKFSYLGSNLKITVTEKFDIEKVIDFYSLITKAHE
jgi:glycosyltransferase involved in cell wall biosynthesis